MQATSSLLRIGVMESVTIIMTSHFSSDLISREERCRESDQRVVLTKGGHAEVVLGISPSTAVCNPAEPK